MVFKIDVNILLLAFLAQLFLNFCLMWKYMNWESSWKEEELSAFNLSKCITTKQFLTKASDLFIRLHNQESVMLLLSALHNGTVCRLQTSPGNTNLPVL
jgi:hypothetical protein